MRSLIVVLFACAAAVSADLFCTPGLQYKDECNICHCSPDGKKAACTDMLCPSGFAGSSRPLRKAEQFCEPNQRFQLSAVNDCTCTSDGQHAMCTLGFDLVKARTYSLDEGKKYCEQGETFSPDNCNICKCSKDGQSALCTLKYCFNDEKFDTENGVVPAAPKQICEPGSEFKDYCNTCHCSRDGTQKACTKMFCDPEIWNADGSFKDESLNTARSAGVKQICEPMTRFKDYCNTCICSDDGTMKACTKMYCPPGIWNADGTLNEIVKAAGRSVEPAKQICKPKTTFKDYCNSCICSNDGTMKACTKMFCHPDLWNADGTLKVTPKVLRIAVEEPKRQICEPGKPFKEMCNHCACSDDGTMKACTKMYCDPEVWNEDGSLKTKTVQASKQICEPMTTFKDYCNTCTCSDDGTMKACTKMFCHPDIWNSDGSLKVTPKVLRTAPVEEPQRQICEPGKPFKEMCNYCACSDDGTMKACTKMYCDPEVWNEDGSLKTKTVQASKQICEPMTTFKDYCNTCTCSDDGTTKACTKMFCHPDIWNSDGTLKVTPKVLRTAPVEEPKRQICEPGKPFREMCNHCACSDDGTMKACTKMMCDPAIWNEDGSLKIQTKSLNAPKQICEPRSTFKNYCNRCTCSDDGTMAVCTRMMCPPGIWNKDGSLVKPWSEVNINEIQKNSPLYKQGDACEPGQSFYSLCNYCVCRADGKSAYCTLKMCY
ncbi:hypothetical protein TKK_0018145 [Trichogramma kaykai]|uniref:Pacifastin domain-containing protein n=1 Tax=Trichogramma kaykai TaxID=54128 RepID=A0ABD2VZZ7_9HYME